MIYSKPKPAMFIYLYASSPPVREKSNSLKIAYKIHQYLVSALPFDLIAYHSSTSSKAPATPNSLLSVSFPPEMLYLPPSHSKILKNFEN